jgi:hypothetical protein
VCCRGQMNFIRPSETVGTSNLRGDSGERRELGAWILSHSADANHSARTAAAGDFQIVIFHGQDLGRGGEQAIVWWVAHYENINGTRTGVEAPVNSFAKETSAN